MRIQESSLCSSAPPSHPLFVSLYVQAWTKRDNGRLTYSVCNGETQVATTSCFFIVSALQQNTWVHPVYPYIQTGGIHVHHLIHVWIKIYTLDRYTINNTYICNLQGLNTFLHMYTVFLYQFVHTLEAYGSEEYEMRQNNPTTQLI